MPRRQAPIKPAQKQSQDRGRIISIVESPIRFFALVVLIIEALMAALVPSTGGSVRMILVIAMVLLLAALVAIVSIFAFVRPEALSDTRPKTEPPHLSTGVLKVLYAISVHPDYPHAYATALRSTNPPDADGWQKASIYACLFLAQVGYVKLSGSEVVVTPAGERALRRFMRTDVLEGMTEGVTGDDAVLIRDQSRGA